MTDKEIIDKVRFFSGLKTEDYDGTQTEICPCNYTGATLYKSGCPVIFSETKRYNGSYRYLYAAVFRTQAGSEDYEKLTYARSDGIEAAKKAGIGCRQHCALTADGTLIYFAFTPDANQKDNLLPLIQSVYDEWGNIK